MVSTVRASMLPQLSTGIPTRWRRPQLGTDGAVGQPLEPGAAPVRSPGPSPVPPAPHRRPLSASASNCAGQPRRMAGWLTAPPPALLDTVRPPGASRSPACPRWETWRYWFQETRPLHFGVRGARLLLVDVMAAAPTPAGTSLPAGIERQFWYWTLDAGFSERLTCATEGKPRD